MPRASARESAASTSRCRWFVWIEKWTSRKPKRSAPAENAARSAASSAGRRNDGSAARKPAVTCTGWCRESAGRFACGTSGFAPFGLRPAPRRAPGGAERGTVYRRNVPSVIDWFPLASIASTSNCCRPESSDPTNSGGTVTLSTEAGTVTWNDPTITW